MASKTREEIIAEIQANSAESFIDWYIDHETGKFYTEDGKDLGFAFFRKKAMFQTTEGYMIELRGVNQQLVGNFQLAYDKKYAPKIPLKRIKIDEGEYYSEGNPSDAAYQDELQRHENNLKITVAAYKFSLSVKNKLPPKSEWDEFFCQQIEALEEFSDKPLKDYVIRYEWIMYLLPTDVEMVVFAQLIFGADMPTVEALQKAEARFQSDTGVDGHS